MYKKTSRPRQAQKPAKPRHSTMDVGQLINKVNDEAVIQQPEHVLEHQFKDFKIEEKLKKKKKVSYFFTDPNQDNKKLMELFLNG